VTVMTMVLGCGGVAGRCNWRCLRWQFHRRIVWWITERMPQALPLQPLPESDQERTAPGLEPGTGVRVATMAAVTPGWRLEGRGKLQREVAGDGDGGKFCLEGSATLVAVRVTLERRENGGRGVIFRWRRWRRIVWAAGPERLQRMARSACHCWQCGVEGLQRTEFDGRGKQEKARRDVAGDGHAGDRGLGGIGVTGGGHLYFAARGKVCGAVKIPSRRWCRLEGAAGDTLTLQKTEVSEVWR